MTEKPQTVDLLRLVNKSLDAMRKRLADERLLPWERAAARENIAAYKIMRKDILAERTIGS